MKINFKCKDRNIDIFNNIIRSCSRLTSLDISGVGQITDQSIINLTNLRIIKTCINRQVTDESISSLINLTNIYISYSNITDEGIKSLTKLKSRERTIHNSKNITDEGVKNLTKLKSIIACNKNITDSGLKNLINLTSIDVNYNENISTKSMGRLTCLKDLKISMHNRNENIVNLIKLSSKLTDF